MSQQAYEWNFDGLVGPTHNYAGLASGNLASMQHAHRTSNPQAAALQGIAKMRLLHQLGVKQAVLPPHARPNLAFLSALGFQGNPAQQIAQAYRTAPELLNACYSASSMWAANTATVTPSSDSQDGKVHFTVANLMSNLHRAQEAPFSQRLLQTIFADPDYFSHHPVIPASMTTRDEGAANHNRLCPHHGAAGFHLFVYGQSYRQAEGSNLEASPQRYPARQTQEASEIIARAHQIFPDKVLFAQQSPLAIDNGVFHNDVIAVANASLFLVHEQAFVNQAQVLKQLQQSVNFPLQIIEVPEREISLADAVSSYLFNSQLLSISNTGSKMMLIAPTECAHNPKVHQWLEQLIASPDNPINDIHYLDLKQSMQNGGGPACLRLRVVLQEAEQASMHQGIIITDALLDDLSDWVKRYYRTALSPADLADPGLLDESYTALDVLTQVLKLGSIYPFQQLTEKQ